ncbi:MAG: hypothetical protein RMN51_08640 [Verrucomicrobiota bacterium]|nr:hypothetical protein [Limisphaera sp.]MDW8382157.1 hypothetical protein [Verrucomicrobiota bacterium]
MASLRAAAIDVGTNSVKLLVVDAGPPLHPILELGIQTRLGEGFYPDRLLQPRAIARTVEAVQQLIVRARAAGAGYIRLFATSAAREARNQEALVRALETATGLHVEVISGLQEAHWAYQGVRTHPELADALLAVVEVGGGSTQLLIGQGPTVHVCESYPLGAVRLWELERIPDPPTLADLSRTQQHVREVLNPALHAHIRSYFEPANPQNPERQPPITVAVGGTAVTLARILLQMATWDRNRIEAVRMSPEDITAQVKRLWSLSLEQRHKLPGLPKERADIILTGAVIYEQLTCILQVPEWRFSTRGIRFGAVCTLLERAPVVGQPKPCS